MVRKRRTSGSAGRTHGPPAQGSSRPGSHRADRQPRGAGALVPLLIVLATVLAVYSPILRAQFVQWDDFRTIAANPGLNPPTVASVLRYWDPRHPYMDLYVPMTYTVWAVVASIARPASP